MATRVTGDPGPEDRPTGPWERPSGGTVSRLGFRAAVSTCFSKYATFSGRAPRAEYWWFALFLFLCSFVASLLDMVLLGSSTEGETGPIAGIFSLAVMLPYLAVGWRRMHDTGRSGLYLLYPLIAMVGIGTFVGLFGPAVMGDGGEPNAFASPFGLVLVAALVVLAISPLLVLWWLTRPSQPGANEYGPNPYGVTS